MTRETWIARSNNPANPNKNVCALHVAVAFGVGDVTKYLHTDKDIREALKKVWSIRPVKKAYGKPVCEARKFMREFAERDRGVVGFVVVVDGHVLACDRFGKTSVDTDPRLADRRKTVKVHAVRHK